MNFVGIVSIVRMHFKMIVMISGRRKGLMSAPLWLMARCAARWWPIWQNIWPTFTGSLTWMSFKATRRFRSVSAGWKRTVALLSLPRSPPQPRPHHQVKEPLGSSLSVTWRYRHPEPPHRPKLLGQRRCHQPLPGLPVLPATQWLRENPRQNQPRAKALPNTWKSALAKGLFGLGPGPKRNWPRTKMMWIGTKVSEFCRRFVKALFGVNISYEIRGKSQNFRS